LPPIWLPPKDGL